MPTILSHLIGLIPEPGRLIERFLSFKVSPFLIFVFVTIDFLAIWIFEISLSVGFLMLLQRAISIFLIALIIDFNSSGSRLAL